jgi:hypothetical protein
MNNNNENNNGNSLCIGRFRLTVPQTLTVKGRSQSIYDVDVSTMELPAGGIEALWDERLKKIRALTPPGAATSSIVREFQLQPGVRSVWYIKSADDPDFRDLDAIQPVGKHAVLATTDVQGGKEDIVETLVKLVLNAYVPETTNGFCVGDGAVTSKPSRSEHTRIAFEHRTMDDIKITFETQTVREPDTQSYSNLDEEKQAVSGSGGKISVLRDQTRSVNALEGKEIWISVTVPRENPFVRFTWHFAGASLNSSQPAINIVATTRAEHQKELESIWESLLQSLMTVPVSPQPAR